MLLKLLSFLWPKADSRRTLSAKLIAVHVANSTRLGRSK